MPEPTRNSKALTRKFEDLPADPQQLAVWIDTTRDFIAAKQAELRALSRIPAAAAAYEATLRDIQEVSALHISAERRLGELLINSNRTPVKDKSTGRIIGFMGNPIEQGTVDKNTARTARNLARADEQDIQDYVQETIDKGKVPTASGAVKSLKETVADDGSKPAKTFYDYWKFIEPVKLAAIAAITKIPAGARTPQGLTLFLSSMEVFVDLIGTWDPAKLSKCPECKGSGFSKAGVTATNPEGTDIPCVYCFSGKSGFFKNNGSKPST